MTRKIANDRTGEPGKNAGHPSNTSRNDRADETAATEPCKWKIWQAERAEAAD